MPNREGWTTKNELDFIMGAGTGKYTHSDFVPRPRFAVLEGYIVGAKLRYDWGGIDKDTAIAVATGILYTLRSNVVGRE